MIRTLCILLLLGVTNAGAEEQSTVWTGNDLLTNCSAFVKVMDGEKSKDVVKAGYCVGYLVGIQDGLLLMEGVATKNKSAKNVKLVCTPIGTSVGQFARVLEKFLKDHPEYLHEPSGVLSYVAFTEAFPCR